MRTNLSLLNTQVHRESESGKETEKEQAFAQLFTVQMSSIVQTRTDNDKSSEFNLGLLCEWREPSSLSHKVPLRVHDAKTLELGAETGHETRHSQ